MWPGPKRWVALPGAGISWRIFYLEYSHRLLSFEHFSSGMIAVLWPELPGSAVVWVASRLELVESCSFVHLWQRRPYVSAHFKMFIGFSIHYANCSLEADSQCQCRAFAAWDSGVYQWGTTEFPSKLGRSKSWCAWEVTCLAWPNHYNYHDWSMIKYEILRRCQRIRSTSCGQAVATLASEAGVRTLEAESALSCQPAKIQLKTIVGIRFRPEEPIAELLSYSCVWPKH